jgi:hypothetical protein
LVGTYTIMLKGTLNDPAKSNAKITFIVTVDANDFVVYSNTAPTLDGSLVDQSVNAGSSVSYSLPDSSDAEGDNVVMTVSLGSASTFVSYSNGKFTISPKASAASGTYTVTVKLTDDNDDPKTTSYTFKIKVIEKEKEVVPDVVIVNSTWDSGLGEGDGANGSNSGSNKPNYTSTVTPLTAWIDSISQFGVLNIAFSADIIVPDNYTTFNESVLKINIDPSPDSDKDLLGLYWNVTEITKLAMTIQITFDNPLSVSSSGVIIYI